MPAVELRAIEVFLALGDELHFARTADRVGLTPSRVSQIIRQLERHAGGSLFERTSRQVRLTPRGARLHDELSAAYAQIEAAFAGAHQRTPVVVTPPATRVEVTAPGRSASGQSRVLTMGVSGWMDEYQQRLISALTIGASPRPVVTVPSDSTRSRVERLASGELDLAFVRLAEAPAEGFVYQKLVTEPLLLAVPAEHPLATRPPEPAPVPLSALDDESLAFYHRDQNPWWYDAVMAGLASAGAEPRVVYRGLWHFDVVSQVRSGSALALLTPSAAATARLEDVVYRRLSPALLTISQGLLWRREPGDETTRLVDSLMRALPSRSAV